MYFAVRAKLQPHLAPPYHAPHTSLIQRLYTLLTVLPMFGLILVVTGFIFLGIATPSESAAMGVIATIIIAALYRQLTWDALKKALMSTMTTSAMMLLVILGSTAFGQLLAASGTTSSLVTWASALMIAPILLVIIMQGLFCCWGVLSTQFQLC